MTSECFLSAVLTSIGWIQFFPSRLFFHLFHSVYLFFASATAQASFVLDLLVVRLKYFPQYYLAIDRSLYQLVSLRERRL